MASDESKINFANENYGKIFKTINLIPKGKVASYGQIADLAGLPGRARLVGKSLACVPDGMAVNWHRVICANGKLAFAPGSSQALKQTFLLQSENVAVFNNGVKMKEYRWQPDLFSILQELEF